VRHWDALSLHGCTLPAYPLITPQTGTRNQHLAPQALWAVSCCRHKTWATRSGL